MLILKASPEFITDLFTPGVCPSMKCTKGLPEDVKLLNVIHGNDGIITFYFDDGNENETNTTVEFGVQRCKI